jgi:hypothetical protein
MVYFHNKNLNFDLFFRAFELKTFVYFSEIWYVWWFSPVLVCCNKKNLASLHSGLDRAGVAKGMKIPLLLEGDTKQIFCRTTSDTSRINPIFFNGDQ